MTYDIDTWLVLVKMSLWDFAYVKDVGYVKACNNNEVDQCYFDDVCTGKQLSNNMVLLACDFLGKQGNKEEYRLCFAVRHPFSGHWEQRLFQLVCQKHETWIQRVRNKDSVKHKNQNIYQMSKNSAFELKERRNFSVYGRELPSPRRFKS